LRIGNGTSRGLTILIGSIASDEAIRQGKFTSFAVKSRRTLTFTQHTFSSVLASKDVAGFVLTLLTDPSIGAIAFSFDAFATVLAGGFFAGIAAAGEDCYKSDEAN
jgi:hypothetical protein